ncbi:peptidase inhibitor 16 isoform X2 [Phascolarctos cinereus]|uniref:Peptidase inhibitor 16 n=1 Tax=Phascolarctos cinereus TaxID=38626 RepID=A0A6P5LHT3_PHACI|nr:peptidase inhibitor 16 isoform X2 [Phascolarctos cinereus]
MQSSHCLPAVFLLFTAAQLSCSLNDEQKQMVVKLHNLYRSQVSPPATNMKNLKWDEDLAAFAKAYASKCVWGHNKDRGRRGENLFAITEGEMDLQLAVEQWYNEHEHYNLSNATCAEGQMCGHYTQVVWAKTERIGCGSQFCEKLEGVMETNIHVLVCNYEPPGNVKGQKPYVEGPHCSQCQEGYECKNQLCQPIIGPEEAGVSHSLPTAAPTSMATETSPNLATETPPSLATKTSTSLSEGTSLSPRLSIETTLKSLETEASKPEPDRGEPTQDELQELLPPSSSSSSSETLATTSLANDELEEVPGTLWPIGHTSNSAPSDLPQTGGANAIGGRTLALHSTLEDPAGKIVLGASSRFEFSLFGLLSCLILRYFF